MATPFLAHLGARLPAGWLPAEALVATRADGAGSLVVSGQPAFGASVDDVAARHGAQLRAQLDAFADDSVAPVATTSGARGLLRLARSQSADGPVAHAVLYTVAGPWSYTAHASGPLAEADSLGALLEGVTPIGVGAPAPAPAPARAAPPAAAPGIAFAAEELVAAAESCGAPSLLGLDRSLFRHDSREAVEAVVRTARRSLVARGVLDGVATAAPAVPTPPYEATLGVALRHDRWVEVTIRRGAMVARTVWAARDRDAVAMSGGAGGLFWLEPLPAAALGGRVASCVGLRGSGVSGPAVHVPIGAVEGAVSGAEADGASAVLALVGPAPAAVRLRHLARRGGVIRGGDATWLVGESGARRAVLDAGEATVRLDPADAESVVSFLDLDADREPVR